MRKNVGLWIDHEKAFVIRLNKDKETIRSIPSDVDEEMAPSGRNGRPTGQSDRGAPQRADRRRAQRLHQWYQAVIGETSDADELLVFGPGLAKIEISKLMEEAWADKGKFILVESADKMTEKQMVECVRNHFEPSAKSTVPLYRRAPGS